MAKQVALDDITCSIERTLTFLGDHWSFLILREALIGGASRFREFQTSLQIPPATLASRLNSIVEAGIFEKRAYQDSGTRRRESYHVTRAGEELKMVLGALQQWGDFHLPRQSGPSGIRRSVSKGSPLSVAFMDADQRPVPVEDVAFLDAPHSEISVSRD
ncbi:winged helix-turn-helix transcriptional regulator [Streptomyces sp. SAS_275]|uniref:winged helix-turn-helix transcriptional regulator n=1 Tax=Streptomyces sp. SAS_275 TaxID=3412746 RepID=UPI00403C76FC